MSLPRFDPRPEVVFLDIGDTLLRAHPSWGHVYAGVMAEFGISATEDDFRRAFEQAFVGWETEGPFEATEAASYERLKELDGRVFRLLGYPELPEGFFRRVEEAFLERSAWWVYPDVTPALDAMRAAGLRLAVISNWGWAAPELLHDLELAGHFEALVISARVGYLKPHRGIFEHALQVMRVAPQRAVHVGDSFRADIVGARSVGITPVMIDRSVREPGHDHGILPDGEDVPLVHDLYELLDLLGVAHPAEVAVS